MDISVSILLMIPTVLFVLILGVLGHYEKNPKRKLLFELIVLIFLGGIVAFEGMLLLQGYYFQSIRHLRKLVSAVVLLFAFLVYAEKLLKNWKQLNDK